MPKTKFQPVVAGKWCFRGQYEWETLEIKLEAHCVGSYILYLRRMCVTL